MVVLRVLGPLEVTRQMGEPLVLASPRQRALLALLTVHAGRVVSAESLADALWGELGVRDHVGALQTQISRLRRALEPAGRGERLDITTRPPGYVLEITGDAVDAIRFERLLNEASVAAPDDAAALLGQALGLWRGPAYGEFADLMATRLEGMRLDELRLGAIERRASALVAAGHMESAVAESMTFVDEHPLREEAQATLMAALYASGRQAEALSRYRAYREQLGEELGLEPSARLQRLEIDILRHEVQLPSVARYEPAPIDGLSVEFLRGRDGRRVAHASLQPAAGPGHLPPVVAVPAWITSLDVIASGRDPRSSILERLARHLEMTMYDRQGTGLSGGDVTDFSIGPAVDELVAVLEEVVRRPAALFAMSQAGPIAVAAAARRPELVTHLVLFGTYADGPATFTHREFNAAAVAMVRAHWRLGSGLLAELFRPGASPRAADHLAGVLRDSGPAGVAAGYLDAVYTTDVSELLARVSTPSLVLHYRGDRVIPFAGGDQLAHGLPAARLVPLDGDLHLPDARDLDQIVDAVLDHLGRPGRRQGATKMQNG